MSRERSSHKSFLYRYLALALVLAALVLAVMGTLAWLQYKRSLQTMTLVQVTDLALEGPNSNTAAIDLGSIDVSESNHKDYVFGIRSVGYNRCTIQLAHTTNIPFTYEIYKSNATNMFSPGIQLQGGYLNDDVDNGMIIAKQDPGTPDSLFSKTYINNSSYNVQKNAAPLYWQCENVEITSEDVTYFILRISWGDNLENNKETDMVYLTIGGGYSVSTQP